MPATGRWLREVEADVLRHIAAADCVFCFLDYDGTLSPLVSTPDQARPLPDTAAVLGALAESPGVRVALVTGRTVTEIRRLIDVPGIYYVGIHGLEICLPDGSLELSERVAVIRAALPPIKRQIEQALGTRPGILIEDKGLALACHYRLASRTDAAKARETVAAVARSYQRRGVQIAVRHGHEVIEIRSAFVNKGKTVCRLLGTRHPSALAVYVGDDQTDEDAFELLPPESITIRVGSTMAATAARYRVADPDEVLSFLRALVDSRRGLEKATAEAFES
jgi:trehalose 6-phosphate phosphatase